MSVYPPIDPSWNEIRVLKFVGDGDAAGDYAGLVHCELETVSLNDTTHLYRQFLDLERREIRASSESSEAISRWIQFTSRFISRDHGIYFPRWRLSDEPSLQDLNSMYGDELSPVFFSKLSSMNSVSAERLPPVLHCLPRFHWGDFEAVSYCWGSDKRDKLIILNGRPMHVPTNLEGALHEFRRHSDVQQGVRLWIDFLCIDQDDTSEKNEQVKRMRDIYSQALAVMAWLGKQEDGSSQAIELLCHLSMLKGEVVRRTPQEGTDDYFRSPHLWLRQAPWADLYSLLSRPYLSRVWILQELAANHAMTVFLCGSKQISRDVLLRGVEMCRDEVDIVDMINTLLSNDAKAEAGATRDIWDVLDRAYTLLTLVDNRVAETKVERVLSLGRRANCSDPRDKIYGLLGLFPKSTSSPVQPDYKLSKQEVYLKFASVLLSDSHNHLDSVLSWCVYRNECLQPSWLPSWLRLLLSWLLPRNGSVLPSWLPDWTIPFERNHVQWLRRRRASRDSIAVYGIMPEPHHLRCRGFVLDLVKYTGVPPSQSLACQKLAAVESCTQNSVVVSENRYGEARDIRAALQRTLVMDHPHLSPESQQILTDIPWYGGTDDTDEPASQRNRGMKQVTESAFWTRFDRFRQSNADFSVLGLLFKDFYPWIPTMSANVDQGSQFREYSNPVRSLRVCVLTLAGRRLMTTQSGYLGLVPEAAKPGDVVAILYGCNFPVILRPRGETYAMIGEAYVDGIMDGEAMEAQERGEYTLEDLVIS
jgi:hypothetical protein